MEFDCVGSYPIGGRLFDSSVQHCLNLLRTEVGDANASDQTLVHKGLHSRPGLSQGRSQKFSCLLSARPA